MPEQALIYQYSITLYHQMTKDISSNLYCALTYH